GNGDLNTSAQALRAAFNFRQQQEAQRLARREATTPNGTSTIRPVSPSAAQTPAAPPPAHQSMDSGTAAPKTGGGPGGMEGKPTHAPSAGKQAPQRNPGPGVPQQIYLEEAKARFNAALTSDIGFVERLVWFWSNHFCVSADKGPVRPVCGAFE